MTPAPDSGKGRGLNSEGGACTYEAIQIITHCSSHSICIQTLSWLFYGTVCVTDSVMKFMESVFIETKTQTASVTKRDAKIPKFHTEQQSCK